MNKNDKSLEAVERERERADIGVGIISEASVLAQKLLKI